MGTATKQFTFSSGATIIASEHNTNFDAIYDEFNGNIANINIKSDAAIANSKLNLSSISQNVTFTGDVTIGDGADTLTINSSSGIVYTPAATWTFTGNQTVSGTWADLGSVTTCDINGGTIDGVTIGATSAPTVTDLGSVATCDINGGTMDGVQVGGTTATGELLVNNSSDAADGLGDQGTAGQFLKSAGAGSNPTWGTGFAWDFVESSSFSTSTSVSVTETISAGDVYMFIYEGTLSAGGNTTFGFRVNSDSTGNDYFWLEDATDTTDFLTPNDRDSAGNTTSLNLLSGSTIPQSGHFLIKTLITANAGETQFQYTFSVNKDSTYIGYATGTGHYQAGTPTSVQLVRLAGSTMTGRVYVYQAKSS